MAEYDKFRSQFAVSPEGVVSIDRRAARALYRELQEERPLDTSPDNYDSETGLHKGARTITHEIIDRYGNIQTISISEHGAMVISHVVHTENGDIETIYGPRPAGNPNQPGDILRGGGMIGAPHNCEDVALTEEHGKIMNFHGVLARSVGKTVVSDPENGTYVFALADNMIPNEVPHQNGVLYLVTYKFNDDGSYTVSLQTHNFGNDDIYLNEVFHPYFNTRKMPPQQVGIGDQTIDLREYMEANQMTIFQAATQMKRGFFEPMSQFVAQDGQLPSLRLATTHYQVEMTPLEGFNENSHVGSWAGNLPRFWCLEMFRHEDEPYNLQNSEIYDDYARVSKGNSSTLAIRITTNVL